MIWFSQRNSNWAHVPYSAKPPHTETIKSSGCGICSACTIIANLTNKYIEPPEMAQYSVQKGYRIDGVGTSHSLYFDIAKKYNLKCTQSYNIYDAVECVRKGGMVVCSTNGGANKLFSTGGHLFVMSDCIGNECEFIDSDNYSGKYQTTYRKQRCYEKDGKIYVNINEAKKHISVYYLFLPNCLPLEGKVGCVGNSYEVKNSERTEKMNKYSYDNTVDKLISLGITSIENMAYWEKCLDGREELNKDNVRTIFDRLIERSSKNE